MKRLYTTLFALLSLTGAAQASEIAPTSMDVRPVPAGLQTPDVTLQTESGRPVQLKSLINKPTVLVFYRGGWCPYCNTQLAGLREIEPKLTTLGYQILAVTPDSPDAIAQSRKDTKGGALPYTLLSDSQFVAAKAFGIAYYLDAKTSDAYLNQYKLNLNKEERTGKVVLPVPAVYLVGADGLLQYSFVHINYKVRLQNELLLHAARLALEKTE